MIDTEILIVGAGPVGLTLALDLARRGIRVMLVEKNPAPLKLPKMERSNPRTMEIYRRLGVIDRIRAAGLPADMPMDVFITTSLAAPPLVHQVYPSVAETRRQIAANTDGTLPREPYQLISQYTLEPILMDALRTYSNATIRQATDFVALEQDETGVTARIQPQDGAEEEVRARYLVGCDGGGSSVRRVLGVGLEGRPQLGVITNIFFRCDDLLEKCKIGFGRHYCIAGVGAHGGAAGVIVVQDDMKHMAFHTQTPEGFDPVELLRDVSGLDIQPEILFTGNWSQHLVVAERHSVGRVFLAGDANHLYLPAGGLGMNTGVGDAANLGWKLEAVLKGWGGPGLLESYGAERSPVAWRNCEAAGWAVEGPIQWRQAFTAKVLEHSEEGRAARDAFVAIADPANRRVYEMHGADRGYSYRSGVIASEEGPAPETPITEYVPSAWPGAHLPHMWLGPDDALYDRLPDNGFTILVLGEDGDDMAPLADAIRGYGATVSVLRIGDPKLRAVYDRTFLLVRPDLHVAWRSDSAPADPAGIAAIVTGHAAPDN